MGIFIKRRNATQEADSQWLVAQLTPYAPADVQAALDAIHVLRGENAQCGCRTCCEQFGDDVEVDGFPP